MGKTLPSASPAVAVTYDATLVMAVEISNKSWVVAAHAPGLGQIKVKQTIRPSAEALAALIELRAAPAIPGLISVSGMRFPGQRPNVLVEHLRQARQPAIRQNCSKLSPTPSQAVSTTVVISAALASASGDVVAFFMALLSVWIRHPEPTAQGEQREL
jgi:hypothetical protein